MISFQKKSTAIKLFVTGLLIYFLYNFINVSFDDIVMSILSAKKHYLISAALLMPVALSIQFVKWHFILRDQGAQVPFKSAVISHLSGMALGVITPARIGELGRAWFLRELPPIKVFSLTIVDKFYSTLAYFSIGIISFLIFFINKYDFSFIETAVISMALLAIYSFIISALLKPEIVGKIFNHYPEFLPKKELVTKIGKIAGSVIRKKVLVVFALGSGVWSLVAFQLWLLVNAFSDVSFLSGISNASAAHFAKTLFPVTFGELGVREASVIYFFRDLGVTDSAAVSAALLLLIMNVLVPSLAGATFLSRLRWSKSSEVSEEKSIG